MSNEEAKLKQVTVDAGSLRAALSRVVQFGREGSGKALLQLKPDGMLVEFGGVTEELPGTGDGEVTLGVSPNLIRGLSQTLSKTGSVTLIFDQERLRIGTTSLKCEVLKRRPPQLLAALAAGRDVSEQPDNCGSCGVHEFKPQPFA